MILSIDLIVNFFFLKFREDIFLLIYLALINIITTTKKNANIESRERVRLYCVNYDKLICNRVAYYNEI